MKFLFILLLGALVTSASAQTHGRGTPTVEQFCGKLTRSHSVPVKGEVNSFRNEVRNLSHVTMQLFPGIEGSTCCEGLTSIATTVTGHWGAFRLKVKGARPGNYWIQAESESKKHSILVQYAPKRYPDQLCYKTYWDIDDEGRLSEGEFIEVD